MDNNIPNTQPPVPIEPGQTPQAPVPEGQTPTPARPDIIGANPELAATQPPALPPNKPRRFPKVLKILLILFLIFLALLFAGGIFVYNMAQKNPVLKNMTNVQNLEQVIKDTKNAKSYPGTIIKHDGTPSLSQTITPGSVTAQIPQWNTYENKGYKFSIDFPADLQAKETAPGYGVSTIEFKSSSDTTNVYLFQILIMPKSIGKIIGQDFDAFYAMNDNSTQVIDASSKTSANLIKLNNRTVGGLRAVEFKSTANPPDPEQEAEIGTYIEAGTNLIIISGAESDKSTLESMLATFKYPI